MKITIAYIAAEEQEAAKTTAALLRLHPKAKIRRSQRNAPFLHIYLTSSKPEKPEKT